LRSNFSSSTLVRQLGEWTPLEADASGMDFAERLSLWLDAFDAIGLQAAHQSGPAAQEGTPQRPPRPGSGSAKALHEDVERVRGALAQAIAQDPRQVARDADGETEGYAPFMQRHQALQRQMEQMIAPLRDHVRQALAQGPARLRQLARLDAALEAVLAKREQQLLPALGALLQRRFAQVQAQGEPLEAFAQDWRQALLAEVDLRLEPVAGLVEALGTDNETT